MTIRERILLESKVWKFEKQGIHSQYFRSLATLPKPSILWIDSSDNLISVRELTNTDPGEILVHRNLASQVRTDDTSLLATLEQAVQVHGVEYIVVCGYSHCGGIRDVVNESDTPPHVDVWLQDLRAMYNQSVRGMINLTPRQKEKLLCEINIQQQIINLSRMQVVQQAWAEGRSLTLLGWYFDLSNGSIQEIFSMNAEELLTQMAPVY